MMHVHIRLYCVHAKQNIAGWWHRLKASKVGEMRVGSTFQDGESGTAQPPILPRWAPCPTFSCKASNFFSPFILMDNTHPSAVRHPQMQMYADTHTHRDATAWALNVITLTSPQPSVMLHNPSCFGYLNPPRTPHMCAHTQLVSLT